jgi:hypothetical protein
MDLGQISKTLRVPIRIFINVSENLNHPRVKVNEEMLENIKTYIENTIKIADKTIDTMGLKEFKKNQKK